MAQSAHTCGAQRDRLRHHSEGDRQVQSVTTLACRECGGTPAECRDQVGHVAVEYLCSRCLMGLGQPPEAPGHQPPYSDVPLTPVSGQPDISKPVSGVRTPAARRQRWLDRQIQAAGGLEAWRLKEAERKRAARAKKT